MSKVAGGAREYAISTCPVPVVNDREFDGCGIASGGAYTIDPCGTELSALISVHADGAEYGVSVADFAIRPTCGHGMRDIATAEQRRLLGIDDY